MMKVLAKVAKIKVATVSYLNTIPFIYGFDHSTQSALFDLRLGHPGKCFSLFSNNEVDIALVPVASLTSLGDCRIIQPFCIGADGKVGSVFLLSNDLPEKIETVFLDLHSMTSNQLVEILCREYWKTNPAFIFPENYPPQLKQKEAVVAIGDKSFKMSGRFKYAFDMAEMWKNFTGKAFVFAVWVTRQNLHPTTIKAFNEALSYGVNNISESIIYSRPDVLPVDETLEYLTNKIKYRLNENLMSGMTLFLDKIKPEWKTRIEFI
jgi:chorismate dehydratase